MDTNKIFGYILLAVGLLLIIVPLWQTYNIFTGNGTPPQVFKTEPVKQPSNPGAFDIQAQVQKAVQNALPLELINNSLNLASWMILMWILMFGGSKLAGIGVQLVKD